MALPAAESPSTMYISQRVSNRVCDLSYYYQWGSNAFGQVAGCLLPTGKGVASISKRFKTSIERSITQLMKSLEKHEQ